MSKTDIVARLQLLLSSDWNLTYIYNSIFSLNNKKNNNTKNQKTHWIILINNVHVYVHRELPK